MPNRKQILAITVLGIVTLMLGCKPNATGIGVVASDPTIEPKPNPVKPKPNPVEPKPNPVEPKPNPVEPKPISKEDVVGTYEYKRDTDTFRMVILDNFVLDHYVNHQKPSIANWSIVGNDIHIAHLIVNVSVYRINPDNSITQIANIYKGIRTDLTKKKQVNTFKKIKEPYNPRIGLLRQNR